MLDTPSQREPSTKQKAPYTVAMSTRVALVLQADWLRAAVVQQQQQHGLTCEAWAHQADGPNIGTRLCAGCGVGGATPAGKGGKWAGGQARNAGMEAAAAAAAGHVASVKSLSFVLQQSDCAQALELNPSTVAQGSHAAQAVCLPCYVILWYHMQPSLHMMPAGFERLCLRRSVATVPVVNAGLCTACGECWTVYTEMFNLPVAAHALNRPAQCQCLPPQDDRHHEGALHNLLPPSWTLSLHHGGLWDSCMLGLLHGTIIASG